MASLPFVGLLLAMLFLPVVASQCASSDSNCQVEGDASAMLQANVIVHSPVQTPKRDAAEDAETRHREKDVQLTTKLQPDVVQSALTSGKGDGTPTQDGTGVPTVTEAAKDMEKTAEKMAARIFGARKHISYSAYVIYYLISWALYVALVLLVWMCCYPSSEATQTPHDIERPVSALSGGHFQCCKSPGTCFWACICPGLRWADTVSSLGWMPMTAAMTTSFLCALLNGFLWGALIWGPCTLLLLLYYRHKLRDEVGIISWSFGSCCIDFFYILLCPCCAIAQEARVASHIIQKRSTTT